MLLHRKMCIEKRGKPTFPATVTPRVRHPVSLNALSSRLADRGARSELVGAMAANPPQATPCSCATCRHELECGILSISFLLLLRYVRGSVSLFPESAMTSVSLGTQTEPIDTQLISKIHHSIPDPEEGRYCKPCKAWLPLKNFPSGSVGFVATCIGGKYLGNWRNEDTWQMGKMSFSLGCGLRFILTQNCITLYGKKLT